MVAVFEHHKVRKCNSVVGDNENIAMYLQASKLELVKRIVDIDNP